MVDLGQKKVNSRLPFFMRFYQIYAWGGETLITSIITILSASRFILLFTYFLI
jgi:hypothetical protein